jgi:hypothetical protein
LIAIKPDAKGVEHLHKRIRFLRMAGKFLFKGVSDMQIPLETAASRFQIIGAAIAQKENGPKRKAER